MCFAQRLRKPPAGGAIPLGESTTLCPQSGKVSKWVICFPREYMTPPCPRFRCIYTQHDTYTVYEVDEPDDAAIDEDEDILDYDDLGDPDSFI